ncbi:MAG: DUF4298 domain-containing protein [Clostridiales bacterium]|nr:DUF4298 domain-containing protein [Clostridiales bacterium]
MDRITRIKKMEECLNVSEKALDRATEALDELEKSMKAFDKLSKYYGSTLWMSDFEADEAGKLPEDLKRGVLSEDAAYNVIVGYRDMTVRMMRIAATLTENVLM